MDLDEERAQWAAETAGVARGLLRLADSAIVLDRGPTRRDMEELNQMAEQLQAWSVGVAEHLNRPGLADELARRQKAFLDWRKLQAGLRPGRRARDT